MSITFDDDDVLFISTYHASYHIINNRTHLSTAQPYYNIQTRQLNLWGFTRDTNSGEWQHKDFIRGRVERLQYIERVENKSKATSSATNAQQLRQTFRHIINTRSKRHKKHVNYSEDKEVSTQEEEDSNNTTNMSPLRKISYVEDNEDTPEDYNSIPSLLPLVESTSPVEYHSTDSNTISSSGYTFEEYPLRYSLLTDETDILYKMATVVMRPTPFRKSV